MIDGSARGQQGSPGGAPNLEPRDDIWPTDVAPIIRANKDGAELIQLRWGFPPGRPKGPPVINMRSEKRRFPRGRCLGGPWRVMLRPLRC
jgi:putative SOS response-associated peptidase YedK